MTKSILITGCSSGIGYDCAHFLQDQGWTVFASCRRQEDCERLQSEGLDSPLLDHSNDASMQAALEYVLRKTGGTLDAVFNNGAFAVPGLVEDLPTDALRENFETNLFGYHTLIRMVIPVMRAQGHGHILNCSSVLGLVAMPFRGSYNTTKFAMEGLTDTLRLEMRGTNIHIVSINPGPIGTKIRENSIPHFEKWIDWENAARRSDYERLKKRLYIDHGKDRFELPPRAVSEKVLKALMSDRPKSHYYVTTATYLMSFFRRVLPKHLLDKIAASV